MSIQPMLRGMVFAAACGVLGVSTAQAQELKGNAEAGKSKNAMCIGCHGIPGYRTAFPVVFQVPKIAGQDAAYLVKALQAYKSGERNHGSMRGIAASLSDQDMADLAAFYGQAASGK